MELKRIISGLLFLALAACSKDADPSPQATTPEPGEAALEQETVRVKPGELDENGTTVPEIDGDTVVIENPRYRSLWILAGNLAFNTSRELEQYADDACQVLGYKQALKYKVIAYWNAEKPQPIKKCWGIKVRDGIPKFYEQKLPALGENDVVYTLLHCRK